MRFSGHHDPGRRRATTGSKALAWTTSVPAKGVLAFGVLLLLLVVVRGENLLSAAPFNPDEAELMAEGRRAATNLLPPYASYTGSTHTFLWPMFLGVLGRLGLPLTLASAHLLSGLAYAWISWAAWFLFARAYGWRYGALLALPTALALFSASAFVALGTELLPVSIIVLAAVVWFGSAVAPGRVTLFVVAVLLGLPFWAKPQTLPLSVVLLLVVLASRSIATSSSDIRADGRNTVDVRDLAVALIGLALPSVLFVLVMTFWGTLSTFLAEPVMYQWSYLASRESSGGSSPGMIGRVLGATTFTLTHPFALLWAAGAGVCWHERRIRSGDRVVLTQFVVWLALVASSAFTLMLVFPIFAHYANILFLGCMLAGTSVVSIGRWTRGPRKSGARKPVILSLVFALGASAALLTALPSARDTVGHRRELASMSLRAHVQPDDLNRTCPSGSDVLVWGWAAELYSYYDWKPASRYVDSMWQLQPMATKNDYRRRMLDELLDRPPTCIVDATATGFFGGFSSRDQFASVMPDAVRLLNHCYRTMTVAMADSRQVQVWRKVRPCKVVPST